MKKSKRIYCLNNIQNIFLTRKGCRITLPPCAHAEETRQQKNNTIILNWIRPQRQRRLSINFVQTVIVIAKIIQYILCSKQRNTWFALNLLSSVKFILLRISCKISKVFVKNMTIFSMLQFYYFGYKRWRFCCHPEFISCTNNT